MTAPMSDKRLAELRSWADGDRGWPGFEHVDMLLSEVDRLREELAAEQADHAKSDQAQVTITRYPEDEELGARVWKTANAAKHGVWASGGNVQPDHVYIRAALCVEHIRQLREPMNEAAHVASLMASSFEVRLDDSPTRAAILAMNLDDPWAAIERAVMTNRRLSGLPPQLHIVDPEKVTS